MKVETKKALRLHAEDGHELIVRHTNRGEPYRQGVEFDLMTTDYNYLASVFLEDREAIMLRDLLNNLYPIKKRWPNGCDESVPAALRYLARHDRPSGGEDLYNSAHLEQLAAEIEKAAK